MGKVTLRMAVQMMQIHVVQRGDTVFTIARRYGASPQRIISDNSISNPRNLVVGQALIILIPSIVYTVRPGDTLSSIADRFGVTAIELIQNNPDLIPAPYLRAGQELAIRFEGYKVEEASFNGYAYPYIRSDVLQRALPYLTTLTIFGYGFTTEGTLIPPADEQPLINLAYRYQTAPVMLLSSITEDGNFSSERASLLFQDIRLQNQVLDAVLAVMQQKGYLGLDLDFEYIQPQDAGAYINFVRNAANRLHAQGYFLNTDLAPKTSSTQRGLLYEGHDYGSLGALSDTVLLMTYEWGYTYGPPLAVAPVNRVQEVVEYAVTQIEADKIMLGIPNYGYDWILPYERGITRATSIGNDYAVEIAARNGVEISFDETAQTPYFEYFGRLGRKHVVWFEDVRSILAKFQLIDRFRLRGAGYWNLMRPFAQNWVLISARYEVRKIV